MKRKKGPQSLYLEENAAKALLFYQENYETLIFEGLKRKGKPKVLGTKPRVCRFCDQGKPYVTFKKKAHAIPELVGNKTLLTLYECDQCNKRFSSFEDDFAKMTLGDRSLA